MQLNQLSLAGGLTLVSALLVACGGGGGGDDAPAAAPAVAAVTASAASRSSTPLALEDTLLTFNGGTCGGGTAPYTTTWSFGDGTTGSTNTHTYADPGTYSVTVTCTDANAVTKTSTALSVVVQPAAMAGFLGRTWSTYAKIDPTQGSLYPVAGITTAGDIYGAWLRSNSDSTNYYLGTTDVAAGSTSLTATGWTMAPDLQVASAGNMTTFNGTVYSSKTAAMDMAVSPGGKAIAAWKAGSLLWYATKDGAANWTTPKSVSVPVIDASIKVVVNDAGDGAVAYCTSSTPSADVMIASVMIYSNASKTLGPTPEPLSLRCDDPASLISYQRSRVFDIAIDEDSKVFAVGLTASGSDFVISQKTYTAAGGWGAATNLSGVLASAALPEKFSFSYSLAPGGLVAGIAWNEEISIQKPNVFARISTDGGDTWGAPKAIQTETVYGFNYPLIAVNDAGDAFLAMERKATNVPIRTYVSNYSAAAGWKAAVVWATNPNGYSSADTAYAATEIAIDEWGTGLLTRNVAIVGMTQAGTFSKPGVWSGFKDLTPTYGDFHYQTMRALPNGSAILVTSVRAITGYEQSGYLLLK